MLSDCCCLASLVGVWVVILRLLSRAMGVAHGCDSVSPDVYSCLRFRLLFGASSGRSLIIGRWYRPVSFGLFGLRISYLVEFRYSFAGMRPTGGNAFVPDRCRYEIQREFQISGVIPLLRSGGFQCVQFGL